jgi:hypothetical protein
VLGAVLIALVVFGSEVVLSGLRTRTIRVSYSVDVRFTPTPIPAGIPTAIPSETPELGRPTPTITPTPTFLFVAAGEAMVINVNWDYRIGPRFQKVIVRATAKLQDRQVAQSATTIDCGSEIMQCSGTSQIALNYTVPDAASQSGVRIVPWPAGDYTVLIEQSAGGLTYTRLAETSFRVVE